MTEFSMPKTGTWEERGGWVVLGLMDDLDLRMENSAGLVGNLGGESRGFKDLQEKRPTVPGSKGGRGWAQWTGYADNNPRRRNFEQWCAENNLDPDSDEGNYRYLVHELKTTEKSALERIRNAQGLLSATRAAHVYFERSGDQTWSETNRRLVWAQRALIGAKAIQATGPEPKNLEPTTPVEPKQTEPAHIPEDLITFEMVEPAIMNLQVWLRVSGDYDGPVDGIPGNGTINGLLALVKRTRK